VTSLRGKRKTNLTIEGKGNRSLIDRIKARAKRLRSPTKKREERARGVKKAKYQKCGRKGTVNV